MGNLDEKNCLAALLTDGGGKDQAVAKGVSD
jgi:hypothetical protein